MGILNSGGDESSERGSLGDSSEPKGNGSRVEVIIGIYGRGRTGQGSERGWVGFKLNKTSREAGQFGWVR